MMSTKSKALRSAVCPLLTFLCFLFFGCQSNPPHVPAGEDLKPALLQLAPGDAIGVTFYGANNLSGTHRIGPEGMVTMPLIGQVEAAGKTAEQLQEQFVGLYSSELKDTNILVTIVGAGNVVYLDGAVKRPGKLIMERPLTALEALMEAGGFSDHANLKKVTIIRYEGTTNTKMELDLSPILAGGQVTPFYLRPKDIVHVPKKMQWF